MAEAAGSVKQRLVLFQPLGGSVSVLSDALAGSNYTLTNNVDETAIEKRATNLVTHVSSDSQVTFSGLLWGTDEASGLQGMERSSSKQAAYAFIHTGLRIWGPAGNVLMTAYDEPTENRIFRINATVDQMDKYPRFGWLLANSYNKDISAEGNTPPRAGCFAAVVKQGSLTKLVVNYNDGAKDYAATVSLTGGIQYIDFDPAVPSGASAGNYQIQTTPADVSDFEVYIGV